MTNNTCLPNPLPCPFCGKEVDITDEDILYPTGAGWKEDDQIGRTYHPYKDVPYENWCWQIVCSIPAGGCGAELPGDSKTEVIMKWNRRT